MLKKLRIKFICINMLIVVTMLSIIFGFVLHTTKRNLERESIQMLQSAARNEHPQRRGKPMSGEPSLPPNYFSLELAQDGTIRQADGFFDLSDKSDYFSVLADTALAESEESGVLDEFGLRYFKFVTPMGTRIAFADVTQEQNTLHTLVHTCLLIGVASLAAFFFISLLLARWAVKPVEQAWQQQKQFVADASHELKTPLTVITTNAELLQSPDRSDAECRQFAGSILTMTRQMRGLVEGLLTLARVDNGTAKMDFADTNLSVLVSDALLPFEPVFFEKGLLLSSDIEPSVHVNGNALQLRQVIEILLDNAQKYASSGGETTVKLTHFAHKRCLLEVSNQGAPISDEEVKNIFKRFYRADKARAMNHSYGLGLSIAQRIAEEHHGKIWCKSRGGYNCFYVEIPCQE